MKFRVILMIYLSFIMICCFNTQLVTDNIIGSEVRKTKLEEAKIEVSHSSTSTPINNTTDINKLKVDDEKLDFWEGIVLHRRLKMKLKKQRRKLKLLLLRIVMLIQMLINQRIMLIVQN